MQSRRIALLGMLAFGICALIAAWAWTFAGYGARPHALPDGRFTSGQSDTAQAINAIVEPPADEPSDGDEAMPTSERVERSPSTAGIWVVVRNALTRDPVPDLRLRVSWDAPHLTTEARATIEPLSEVVTDAEGRVRVPDLFAGQTYRFALDVQGYFDTTFTRVIDATRSPITIELEPLASLTVQADLPDGTPASQTVIIVSGDSGRATQFTDERGTCTFESLRPGDYQVTAQGIGGPAQAPRSITVRRGTPERLRLPVERLVTIVVHAAGLPLQPSPLPPMALRDDTPARSQPEDWILLDTFAAPRAATPSENGTWRFDHVAKGAYTLEVEFDGTLWTARLDVAASRAEEHYTVTFAKQR
ncbi:MAG: carboxypeptidase regulatory-like domain-containing protein [Planctomycetes bacterium]|nr:carboxypeptidase regulatory-like domain-containing protein [Planctomycetota bacterium]